MSKFIPYIYLSSSILLTVFAQIIMKWRIVNRFADTHLPKELWGKIVLLFTVVFDPFIFTGLVATFVSGLFWMATMTKLDLSYAYPFSSIGFILVLLCSALILGESMNAYKIIGILFIMLGIFIASKG